MPYEKIPKYFYKFKSNLKQWHDWNINNNFTPIETCIGFINTFERIDKIIVGIDNLNQLQEIIKLINIRDNKFKNMDLLSNDINLIDPSRWSL
jgi:predicted aldo/keto reductase-like oxidoreductase